MESKVNGFRSGQGTEVTGTGSPGARVQHVPRVCWARSEDEQTTNGQLNTVYTEVSVCIVGTHWYLFLTERVQREYFIFNTHWKWVLDKATHITEIFQFSFPDVLLFIHIYTTGMCGGILSYFTSKHNVVNSQYMYLSL